MPLELGPDSLIITIDGPAGTGKSTVAHRLAKRLGVEVLDTGAMYRAAGLLCLERDIDPTDGPAIAEMLGTVDLHFEWSKDPPAILIGERDVSRRIREPDVDRVVSVVARQKEVRSVLVHHQRRIANRHPRLVTEGRDQGTVVFPEAPVHFYLDAAPEVRASRRVTQLAEQGLQESFAEVLRDIGARDELDSKREESPLRAAPDAIVIDTGAMSLDNVVATLERHVMEQVPEAFSSDALRPR